MFGQTEVLTGEVTQETFCPVQDAEPNVPGKGGGGKERDGKQQSSMPARLTPPRFPPRLVDKTALVPSPPPI